MEPESPPPIPPRPKGPGKLCPICRERKTWTAEGWVCGQGHTDPVLKTSPHGRRRQSDGSVQPPKLTDGMLATAAARYGEKEPLPVIARDLGVSCVMLANALTAWKADLKAARASYEHQAVPVLHDAIAEIAHRLQTKPGSIRMKELNALAGTLYDKLLGKDRGMEGLSGLPDSLVSQLAERRVELAEFVLKLTRVRGSFRGAERPRGKSGPTKDNMMGEGRLILGRHGDAHAG